MQKLYQKENAEADADGKPRWDEIIIIYIYNHAFRN